MGGNARAGNWSPQNRGAGWLIAQAARMPLARATISPPIEEKAWVKPKTPSRCWGWGKSSLSQATAATNSTQTPMKTRTRNTSSMGRLVEKPAANAEKA